MADLPAPRRYSDEEVAQLLKRATELQAENRSGPRGGGLTLPELEEIGAEAGIDLRSLRQAAAELDTPPERGSVGRLFAGGPVRILLERTLPFEVSSAGLDSLIPIIEIAAEAPGSGARVGSTLSWRSDDKQTPRRMRVVVSVRAGTTAVRIEDSYGTITGVLYGVVVAPTAGASGGIGVARAHALALPLLLPATPLLVAALGATAVRLALPGRIRRRRRLLARLLEDICESLAGSATERQLAPPGGAAGPAGS